MNNLQNKIVYKNAQGKTKYYATYQNAWIACNRLNQKESKGIWRFEADKIGWYLQLEQE